MSIYSLVCIILSWFNHVNPHLHGDCHDFMNVTYRFATWIDYGRCPMLVKVIFCRVCQLFKPSDLTTVNRKRSFTNPCKGLNLESRTRKVPIACEDLMSRICVHTEIYKRRHLTPTELYILLNT